MGGENEANTLQELQRPNWQTCRLAREGVQCTVQCGERRTELEDKDMQMNGETCRFPGGPAGVVALRNKKATANQAMLASRVVSSHRHLRADEPKGRDSVCVQSLQCTRLESAWNPLFPTEATSLAGEAPASQKSEMNRGDAFPAFREANRVLAMRDGQGNVGSQGADPFGTVVGIVVNGET